MILSSLAKNSLFSNDKKKQKRLSIVPQAMRRGSNSSIEPPEPPEEELELVTDAPFIRLKNKVRLLQPLDINDTIVLNGLTRDELIDLVLDYSTAICSIKNYRN